MPFLVLHSSGCNNGESVVPDARVGDARTDAIWAPDFMNIPDGAVAANIGAPCDPRSGGVGCAPEMICLDVLGEAPAASCDLRTGHGCGGICTIAGCTPEDLETPDVEDTCPKVPHPRTMGATLQTTCTQVPGEQGPTSYCLLGCDPQVAENPCAAQGHAGITCHPASIVFNGHTEVCLFPACASDSDCGNRDALKPDSICLAESGICLNKGNETGKTGGACTGSKDCGPYQYCLTEGKGPSGETVFEGGYCTVVGCKYHTVFYDPEHPEENLFWQCPPESKCFYMGSADFVSFCLAVDCDPAKPEEEDGCRDESSPGQYACTEIGSEKVCWLPL